jgi:pilus assembly protein Flp/PilA
MRRLTDLLKCVRGATAVEYGLIAATITVAMLSALTSAGNQTSGTFDRIATEIDAAASN